MNRFKFLPIDLKNDSIIIDESYRKDISDYLINKPIKIEYIDSNKLSIKLDQLNNQDQFINKIISIIKNKQQYKIDKFLSKKITNYL